MTKTKVVGIDDLYNFVVDDFFSWDHLVFKNVVWSSHNLKFKFCIVQSNSDREMTKRKNGRFYVSSTTLVFTTFSYELI